MHVVYHPMGFQNNHQSAVAASLAHRVLFSESSQASAKARARELLIKLPQLEDLHVVEDKITGVLPQKIQKQEFTIPLSLPGEMVFEVNDKQHNSTRRYPLPDDAQSQRFIQTLYNEALRRDIASIPPMAAQVKSPDIKSLIQALGQRSLSGDLKWQQFSADHFKQRGLNFRDEEYGSVFFSPRFEDQAVQLYLLINAHYHPAEPRLLVFAPTKRDKPIGSVYTLSADLRAAAGPVARVIEAAYNRQTLQGELDRQTRDFRQALGLFRKGKEDLTAKLKTASQVFDTARDAFEKT